MTCLSGFGLLRCRAELPGNGCYAKTDTKDIQPEADVEINECAAG